MEKENSKIENNKLIEVAKSSYVPEGKGIRLFVNADSQHELAIFRVEGKLYCFSNICPHLHIHSIYRGKIENGILTCPEHGWKFSIETGEKLDKSEGGGNLVKYEVIERDGKIFMIAIEKTTTWKNF